jgi:CDP-diacylglycerol--serine O-phosphatidyltransferase
MIPGPRRRGIPLRGIVPNAVTTLALCFGLTGVRFAIGGEWEKAVACVFVAGLLDGMDGRIARLLRAESRFGAELDSLSDVIAFGVSPAVILFLWSLSYVPRYGWVIALAHAACCALRLARYNALIDSGDQPLKKAGFFTGVPAPAGAAMALLPVLLWLATGLEIFRATYVVAPWTILIALLMISSLSTYGWTAFRLRRDFRLPALLIIGLLGAALINDPWSTLSLIIIAYAASIPFAIRSSAKIRPQPEPAIPPASS